MAQGYGYNGWVGVGRESTWGTAVSPTVFEKPTEESLKLNQSKIHVPTLGTVSKQRRIASRRFVDGGFKVPVGFNGMLAILLKDAMGACSTAQVAATSAYDHTLTLLSAMGASLTVQSSRDAANIGTAYDYTGCQIESLTLRQGAETPLEIEVAFQGKEEEKVAEASDSFVTLYQADYSMFSVTVGGVAQLVRDFEITIANDLNSDRNNLGSRLRAGIGRGSGPREVSGSMTVEFDAVTEYDLFRDQTETAVVAAWAAPASSIESGYNYDLTMTMPTCQIEGPPEIGMKDNGMLLLPFDFMAFATAADNDEMSAVLRNTDTAVI